jgi:imidazolonepropionase-like amidohydrolase
MLTHGGLYPEFLSLLFSRQAMRFAVALALCCCAFAADRPLALQDVTIVDVQTSALHAHQNVVITAGKIASIGATIPASARIVPAHGKFLIPGLWDMHVHLWYPQNQLATYLAFGVTGVRDMGSDFTRTCEWRAAIESGKMPGPRIITPGPPVDGHASDDDKLPVIVARDAPEARQAFDKLWNMDVDFVKVLGGLSRDAYFALAEQARHWHVPLEGHIPDSVSAWDAIEARQHSIEHMFGVMKAVSNDPEAINFFEQCAIRGVRITPTLVLWQRMAHKDDERLKSDPRLKFVPEAIRKTWIESEDDADPEVRRQIDSVYRLVSLSTRTKVEILAGTDTGDPYTIPGATLHDELEQLVAAGMSPHQALEAATIAPARFLELDDEMGTIEKGKDADLVLLDANPLDDINNVRKISAVIARGRYFSRKDLDALLAARN